VSGTPPGYLGAEGRVASGPSDALVDAGYQLEIDDAPLLHRGLGIADLAHVMELHEIGVLPTADAAALARVLLELLDMPADEFPYDPRYGDAYNSRERELTDRLGAVAGWLPTGRTRREAGRIAFRLALRSALLDLHEAVAAFGAALVERSTQHAATLWNDTTYLQPAQPSSFGHYLGAFAAQTTRDLTRVAAAYRWADRSPAGTGGVAGTRIPLDRRRLARRLGFAAAGPHSRDVMWAADGLTDAVVAATQAALTADRLAEDLEIFASPQFGYVTLAGASSRASVLLPQKRNPYALAVIRGGAGTLIGRTTGVMVTQRTPSARTDNWLYAYGDVLRSVELAVRLVILATDVVTTLTIERDALEASAGAHFSVATDLTEWLVLNHGLDYRSAYRIVGRAVVRALAAGRQQLTPGDVTGAAHELDLALPDDVTPTVTALVDIRSLLSARDCLGSAAPARVAEHCAAVSAMIADSQAWADNARLVARRAESRVVADARALADAAAR
jgi:argininosuccinate lyase